MPQKPIYIRYDLSFAMHNYNHAHNYNFNITDLFTLEALLSDAYTNDAELARMAMCSLRTIKRSINKLCEFGFITKHLAHDNTKTLELHHNAIKSFLDQYFYAEPYDIEHTDMVAQEGDLSV